MTVLNDRDDRDGRDGAIAAMLAARADRMPSNAGREVMAAVREEMRAPIGAVGFAVLPVTRSRGMNGPVGLAAIGLVAVLVLAVMGGRLTTGPAQPPRDGVTVGPLASAGADAASRPPATQAAVIPAIPTLTMDQLHAGLSDGSLDGRTILVTGRLAVQPWPCPTPMPDDCYGLQLRGLDGVEIGHAGVLTATEAFARIPGETTDRPIAFRVTRGQLVWLGWITKGADTPLTVHGLAADAPGRAEVAIVSGWLIPPPTAAACPPPRDPNTPCGRTTPLLSDAPPTQDGESVYAEALNVGLDPSIRFGPDGAATAGPFLVRHMAYRGGNLPPYQVVAALDPATTVRVVPADASPAMTPEQLRAVVEDGSMDGRLIAIRGWLQPSGASCPADLPQPCTLFAILGLGDVPVTWDGPLSVTTRPPAPTPLPAQVAGTLVVTPRGGSLRLLGRLPGSLERPLSLQEVLSRDLLTWRLIDPMALTPVAGWLVVGGTHSCPMLGPGATPCPAPGPLLTDEEPTPEGIMMSDLQMQVGVSTGAPGIDTATVVTEGPFLVVRSGTTWDVMARYDLADIRYMVVP